MFFSSLPAALWQGQRNFSQFFLIQESAHNNECQLFAGTMRSFQYEHYPSWKWSSSLNKKKEIKWNIIGKFQAQKIGGVHDAMSLQELHKYAGEIIYSPAPTAFA